MTHSELAKCKNLHLAVGVRYIVDMSRFAARFPWWWPGVAIAALAVAALSFVVARDIALGSARQDASAAARLQAALLDSEIARFRLLPLALADDRDITRAVAGDVAVLPALDRKLEALARATGAGHVRRPTGLSHGAACGGVAHPRRGVLGQPRRPSACLRDRHRADHLGLRHRP